MHNSHGSLTWRYETAALALCRRLVKRKKGGRRREVKRSMKHISVLTCESPAKAEQAAYVTKKDVISPWSGRLEPIQAGWLALGLDEWLQK